MTGTYDCAEKNQVRIDCPKTANQSENFRTNQNNSCEVETSLNTGFGAINCNKTALSYGKCPPAFLGQKIGATGLEPATS
jgi:hypothetical protein